MLSRQRGIVRRFRLADRRRRRRGAVSDARMLMVLWHSACVIACRSEEFKADGHRAAVVWSDCRRHWWRRRRAGGWQGRGFGDQRWWWTYHWRGGFGAGDGRRHHSKQCHGLTCCTSHTITSWCLVNALLLPLLGIFSKILGICGLSGIVPPTILGLFCSDWAIQFYGEIFHTDVVVILFIIFSSLRISVRTRGLLWRLLGISGKGEWQHWVKVYNYQHVNIHQVAPYIVATVSKHVVIFGILCLLCMRLYTVWTKLINTTLHFCL